jgi:di/tricarboxylate transporter
MNDSIPSQTATRGRGRIRLPWLLAGIAILAGLYLMVSPPSTLGPEQGRAAGLAVIVIGLWATGAMPEHFTALLFFVLALLLQTAPARVIFSGFASGALWLTTAGLVIAVPMRTTGLSERLARSIALRVSHGYLPLIGGMVTVGLVLGFLMPSSMARVTLLIPIALALAEHSGFGPGSNGRTGVILAAAFGAFLPTFAILTANVPNLVLLGAAEAQAGVVPHYGEYLLLHFPVLGLIKAILIVLLIVWRYPDRPRPVSADDVKHKPMSRSEWKMAAILAVALAMWMSDALHHISPVWIGLAAAIALVLPGVGLLGPRQLATKVNYNPALFVAGILGLGALLSYSGLGAHLAAYLTGILPLAPGHNPLNFVSLIVTAMVTGVLATLPGVPAVLTPLAKQLAHSSGMPVQTVLMTQVIGFSTPLFLYQAAPLVVAMQLAGEKTRAAIVLCLQLALVTLLLLLPLDYLWWRLLGWL